MSIRNLVAATFAGLLMFGWSVQADPAAPARADKPAKEFDPGGKAYWKYRVSGDNIADLKLEAISIKQPSFRSPKQVVEAYLALWYPVEPEATLAYDRAVSEVNGMELSVQKSVMDEFLAPELAKSFDEHDQSAHRAYVKKLAAKKPPFSFDGDSYSGENRVASVEIIDKGEVWVHAESVYVSAATDTFNVSRRRFLCRKNEKDEWRIFGEQSWDSVDVDMDDAKEEFGEYSPEIREWRDGHCVAAAWATQFESHDLPEPDCSTPEKAVQTLWSVARFRFLNVERAVFKQFGLSRLECCREFFDAEYLATKVKEARKEAEAKSAEERAKMKPDSIKKLNEDTAVVRFAVKYDNTCPVWILNKVGAKWLLAKAGYQDVDKETGKDLEGEAHFKPCENFLDAIMS
ncbi:MAG: hypothetical protein IT462_10320 [Planctomycetes bacterium]|nr:hypothetical protein [Planctomycetota bacterium]